MAQHKHWAEDHPRYGAAPVCRFRTIKACDENWTQFQHGHMGTPCVKAFQEMKTKRGTPSKVATCTITEDAPAGMSYLAWMRFQIERVNAASAAEVVAVRS